MPTIDPEQLHSILLAAAALALLFAAAHDVAVRTVPNLVPLIVAASGLGINALGGHFVSALFDGALVFSAAWYGWRRGWIGGGDVKLLGACALLVPPASVPSLVLCIALAGGVLAVFYVVLARLLPAGAMPRPAGLFGRIWRAERRRIRRRLSIPYACAISAGALLTLTVWAPLGGPP